MACGVDLWDVPRSVRAGGVVLCERCLVSMAEQLDESDASGQVELVVPPRLTGPAPDDEAVTAVAAALFAVFRGTAAERTAALLGDDEVGPMLEQARNMYASMNPQLVVNRVRFPEPDRAQVRFRFVLSNGPVIDGQGEVVRRNGSWLVTPETVLRTVPQALSRVSLTAGTPIEASRHAPEPPNNGDPQAGPESA